MRPVDVVIVFMFGAACAAAGLTLAGPACGQTFAVEPLPPAGYLGIDTSKAAAAAARDADRAERRSQAQRAADRRARQEIARIAPAAGDDLAAGHPHVLWILRKQVTENVSAGKLPAPGAGHLVPGTGVRGELALVLAAEMSAITHQVFGDRPACEINLQVLGQHTDPDQVALYCLPQRTR